MVITESVLSFILLLSTPSNDSSKLHEVKFRRYLFLNHPNYPFILLNQDIDSLLLYSPNSSTGFILGARVFFLKKKIITVFI